MRLKKNHFYKRKMKKIFFRKLKNVQDREWDAFWAAEYAISGSGTVYNKQLKRNSQ